MDMPGIEGMTGSTGTTGLTGMTSMSPVAASSPSATPSVAVISTPTLLASGTSETAHSDEVTASSSAAPQMGSMPSMSGMSNAFHFGVGDTLWTESLTPKTGQSYAGAIILLILIMALFLRFLATLRGMAEKRWNPKQPSRCDGNEADNYVKMGESREDEAEARSGHRWSATIQLTRALFQLTTMTVGYLLMLAVMTFNLGYLLAVLAGGFLGELALGWIKH